MNANVLNPIVTEDDEEKYGDFFSGKMAKIQYSIGQMCNRLYDTHFHIH